MTLPKSGVRILLILLYITAVWIRLSGSSGTFYPYFKGESGTNYRHALAVGTQGGLPAHDPRFFWPEGYSPADTKAVGAEYLTGVAIRLGNAFSDMPQKKMVSLFTVLAFSLCVFTFYGFTRLLWQCQTAGLLAALLLAFSRPLVEVTLGSEYLHGPFALLLVSLHLWLFLSWRRTPSTARAIWTALAALALLATWEAGPAYVALFGVAAVLLPGGDTSTRRTLLTWHAAVMILAAALLPHLQARRLIADWPVVLVVVSTAYSYVRQSLPSRFPAWVYLAAGALPLVLILRPIHIGGVETLSEVQYWFYRLRFIAGKPADPQLLPESVRFLWSHGRSTPAPYTLSAFFVPLIFLLTPAFLSLRGFCLRTGTRVWPPVVVGLLGALVFWLDRGTVYAAALILFPLLAVSGVALGKHLVRRGTLVAISVLLVVTSGLMPLGKANAIYRAGDALGVSPVAPDGFAPVSLGNADLDLVRYVVSRTSVGDPFLVPPELSSLVVTFAGRKTMLVPGAPPTNMAQRTGQVIARFYEDEGNLYTLCKASGIRYVVSSIDLLLDTSRYSPLYTAGRRGSGEDAVARRMHFAPEKLRHFNLVYQNDVYRLFRVVDDSELTFLTDHPPVYQYSILERNGDTLESFYMRVVDILATYHTAVAALARDDEEGAIRRFRYCLEQAPRFSKAWMGVGDSLLRLRDFRAANAAYMRVLENAPDNSRALYYAALTFGHIKEVDRALGLLEVLFATGGERELLGLAQQLKVTLEKGIPLDGSPRPEQTP
jgi:hypothetical protein